ncbi:hypothetical protein WAI453_011933 [Rhynchosporium graminicola]
MTTIATYLRRLPSAEQRHLRRREGYDGVFNRRSAPLSLHPSDPSKLLHNMTSAQTPVGMDGCTFHTVVRYAQ